MKHPFAAAALAALLAGPAGAVTVAERYSSFIVFGDSLSDPGNLYAATGGAVPQSPPYYAGRFSDGPVWAETLGAKFAAEGKPVANYAFGGAKAVQATDSPFDIPDLADELGLFAFSGMPAALGPEPLAALWFGGNDLFKAQGDGGAALIAAAEAAADAVADAAQSLFLSYGIEDILLVNLGDVGATPAYAGGPLEADMTAATLAYNARLGANADLLRLSGLKVTLFDSYALGKRIADDPAAYGITNATDACFDGATVCADPTAYAFFDGVHPSSTAHNILAARIEAALPVPVPAAGGMLLLGLGALAAAGARRKAA
ncbi:SGNH/GDSL hydrolase family protein [Oceanicella actignis]|uniref:SGNH/GDSL hydrolase family protein n=1 Tax=Oceanicella actignis TaxID=1189325 RepID=UPI0011E76B7F|nr:SGNH/GDSL hydrolase family protein [Oceanicella actignis]TYO89887.1 outer membrane lipase/esterase [Oceanicella actignis]